MKDSKTNLNSIAGQRIRMLRKVMGLSQVELAAKLNLSYQQVQKYESGKNNISLNMLAEICKNLNVDPVKLLEKASFDMSSNVENASKKHYKGSTQKIDALNELNILEDVRIYKNIVELLTAITSAGVKQSSSE